MNDTNRDTTLNRDTKLSTADLAQAGETEHEPTRPGGPHQRGGPEQQRFIDETKGSNADRSRAVAVPAAVSVKDGEPFTPLFSSSEAGSLRSRWEAIQVQFVDEPRGSVQQADQLVAEAIKHLAEGFANERQKLEEQWGRGDNVSTEDLRISLRRYRSFFERLLAV